MFRFGLFLRTYCCALHFGSQRTADYTSSSRSTGFMVEPTPNQRNRVPSAQLSKKSSSAGDACHQMEEQQVRFFFYFFCSVLFVFSFFVFRFGIETTMKERGERHCGHRSCRKEQDKDREAAPPAAYPYVEAQKGHTYYLQSQPVYI